MCMLHPRWHTRKGTMRVFQTVQLEHTFAYLDANVKESLMRVYLAFAYMHVRTWWQVDHAIQFGEDADVKIRDLGMGELGGDDI